MSDEIYISIGILKWFYLAWVMIQKTIHIDVYIMDNVCIMYAILYLWKAFNHFGTHASSTIHMPVLQNPFIESVRVWYQHDCSTTAAADPVFLCTFYCGLQRKCAISKLWHVVYCHTYILFQSYSSIVAFQLLIKYIVLEWPLIFPILAIKVAHKVCKFAHICHNFFLKNFEKWTACQAPKLNFSKFSSDSAEILTVNTLGYITYNIEIWANLVK